MRAAPELANVKVIMMTALGQAEDRARGEKLGVVKYLVKSQVTLEDFVRIVREVMPPDQSGSAPAPPQSDDTAEPQNNINQQESETSMQDDNQSPSNPAPDAGAAPAGDPAVNANPISGAPASPLGDVSSTAPQTTAEETSTVKDQIDNFESDPAAGASAPSMPPADAGTASDSPVPDAGAVPTPDSGAPASDPAAPPADTSAPSEPPANGAL
jgi:hypothetical protein